MLLPLGFFQFMFFSFQELRANFDSRTLDLTILSSPVFQCLGALTVNYGKSDMLYRYKCVTVDCPWRFYVSFQLWCLLSKWRQTQMLRCQFMLSGRVLAQDIDLPPFVCLFLFTCFELYFLLPLQTGILPFESCEIVSLSRSFHGAYFWLLSAILKDME